MVLSEAGQLLRRMPTLVGGGRRGEGKISRGIANCLFKDFKSSLPYNQALPFQTTLHPRCHPGGAPRLSRSVLDIQGQRLTRPPIKSSSSSILIRTWERFPSLRLLHHLSYVGPLAVTLSTVPAERICRKCFVGSHFWTTCLDLRKNSQHQISGEVGEGPKTFHLDQRQRLHPAIGSNLFGEWENGNLWKEDGWVQPGLQGLVFSPHPCPFEPSPAHCGICAFIGQWRGKKEGDRSSWGGDVTQ